jgi:hypothetical protein
MRAQVLSGEDNSAGQTRWIIGLEIRSPSGFPAHLSSLATSMIADGAMPVAALPDEVPGRRAGQGIAQKAAW